MIYIITGSPNTDGLTENCAKHVMEGLQLANQEYEEVNLTKINLQHCQQCDNGWGDCAKCGECRIKDDFEKVYSKMREADGIIFITPVYFHDLAECFKALMDRLRRNETHGPNHYLENKQCLLIASAGGGGYGCSQCLSVLEDPIRHMKMHAVDRIGINQYSKEYVLPMLVEAGKKFGEFVKK